MIVHLNNFSALCSRAWRQAESMDIPGRYADINRVMVLGMGGSAIGADLIAGLCLSESKIPVSVNRSYHLPAFVDDRTLFIACSYSGYTEETLTALEEALNISDRIIVVTNGGKLKISLWKEISRCSVSIMKLSPGLLCRLVSRLYYIFCRGWVSSVINRWISPV
jgi:glucose-6-phosphate isomerase